MSTLQKAVRFSQTGPISSVLTLASIPKPTPTPGFALVRIKASAINPSDVMNVEGRFAHLTTTPRTPGRDFAGVVEEAAAPGNVGKYVWGTGGTNGFDRDGSHAEWILVPDQLVREMEMPKNLSFAQAAACGVPYLTAGQMVEKAALKEGEYVLVLGSSGGVGSAAVQLARLKGAIPIETSRNEGAGHNVININADLPPQIKTATGGKGISAVIDTVGSDSLFKRALEALAPLGRYVLISVGRSPGPQFTFDAFEFYRNNKTLIGINTLIYSSADSAGILSKFRAGFEEGLLLPPALLQEVDLADEKAVLEAYANVKGGAKAKHVLVNKNG